MVHPPKMGAFHGTDLVNLFRRRGRVTCGRIGTAWSASYRLVELSPRDLWDQGENDLRFPDWAVLVVQLDVNEPEAGGQKGQE